MRSIHQSLAWVVLLRRASSCSLCADVPPFQADDPGRPRRRALPDARCEGVVRQCSVSDIRAAAAIRDSVTQGSVGCCHGRLARCCEKSRQHRHRPEGCRSTNRSPCVPVHGAAGAPPPGSQLVPRARSKPAVRGKAAGAIPSGDSQPSESHRDAETPASPCRPAHAGEQVAQPLDVLPGDLTAPALRLGWRWCV